VGIARGTATFWGGAGAAMVLWAGIAWQPQQKITFTRSRAGRKNDWSVVRRAVGYHRYVTAATPERQRERPQERWKCHRAANRFVAGQARAVIELLSGRENLPVTSWRAEAVRGLGNRPTLLSNAETFAQVGVLLTLRGDTGDPVVLEIERHTVVGRSRAGRAREPGASRWLPRHLGRPGCPCRSHGVPDLHD